MILMEMRPHVLMISEVTLDGKLTIGKGVSSKILMRYMSPESEKMLHQTRAEYDAIMVGSSTIKTDNSSLTVRLVKGKNPLRIIPSSMADLPLDRAVFDTTNASTVLAVSEKAPEERLALFREKGVQIVVAGKEKIDFPLLMDILVEKYGVKKLIIEGGSTLNWLMLHNHLVSEIRIIHMPFIVGGTDTPSLVGGERLYSENEMISLSLKKTSMYGTNLVTEYDVTY